MERREFISAVTALGALAPLTSEAEQRREVDNYWADVQPGATLWGLAIFLTDEPIEFTIGADRDIQSIRGRFDGQRLRQYSWHNGTGKPQRIAVRARALAGDRELPPSRVRFISDEHVYVAFGRRGIPEKPSDRYGSYPFEAVFVGFITFGE